jgi:hypothetical protein
MALSDVTDWIDEHGQPGNIWYAKRLAANDTLATHSHQAGPYIPKEFIFKVFPFLNKPSLENPDHRFNTYIDSHVDHKLVRAVWYNNKLHQKGTRNETRLTGFGGIQSAVLDPENTGAIAILSFKLGDSNRATECHIWVCRNEMEELEFEQILGLIEPKEHVIWEPGTIPVSDLFDEPAPPSSCRLNPSEIPTAWIAQFPTGEEIVRKAIERRPPAGTDVDVRLLRRRACEYELFQSIEQAVHLPRIKEGFLSIEGFVSFAQTILQSRKSRSGKSLELHAREIMKEEGLLSGTDFSHGPTIDGGKRPDFIFPNKAAYDDQNFPEARLRMLAAKTTCKDRWRQVLNEASRITNKHLLTLQEGVSEGQFREMRAAGVQLVVPVGLHGSYPPEVRPYLISFESFIGEVRLLNLAS